MNLRIVMLLMTLLKKNRLKNNYTLRLVFNYRKEDLEQLWKMTVEAANFLEVDPEWVKTKFGIEVTGTKKADTSSKLSLNIGESFFV